jgi:hypothetical protein
VALLIEKPEEPGLQERDRVAAGTPDQTVCSHRVPDPAGPALVSNFQND